MPNNTSTVFIVDDDPSIRESLSLLLNSAGYIIKTFDSATEFLELGCVTEGTACLVLDVKMPGLSGLDLQQELNSRKFSLPVIFITGHGDVPMSVQAMKKGAVDFLSKPFDDNELLNAIHEALANYSEVRLNQDKQKHFLQKLESLTPREYEVLRYLITGMIYKQIAAKLKISEWTVKAHRKQIFHKMAVDSLAELVRLTEMAGVKPIDIAQ